jgi:hypothetical protein
VKKISALLLTVLLAAASRGAAAQEAPSGPVSDLPPGLGMPGDERNDLPLDEGMEAEGDAALVPVPDGEDIAPGVTHDGFEGSILGEPMRMLSACPSLFESSGTWLRRGFWYTEVDYLLLSRSWDKHGVTLASEEAIRQNNPTGQPFVTSDILNLEGHSPGGEGVGRVKLGRFLFRDNNNRDHSVEGSWWGGGDFQQAVSLESAQAASTTVSTTAAPVGLQVSNFIDRVNLSFDGASAMAFQYDNQTNTGELNYLVRSRLHRDRMLLEPGGQWVRAATPTKTYSFLTGVRYLSLDEMLDWTAEDRIGTATVDEGGHYLVETHNQLIGTQLGGSLGFETARWSIIGSGKAGAYWNRINLNSSFDLNRTTDFDGFTNSREDDLSFVGEAQLLAKWHLRPNVSLRAGLELLFVDSVALAPHQVNFIPGGYSAIANSGDSVFLGTSLGVEAYW